VALDMGRFRALFLEEAAEQLAEISRALLELEKDTASVESIDTIFRMAHSIKSMAASVGYDSVEQVAHALEDRMEGIRASGCVPPGDSLSVLFRGLDGLEQMVEVVRETDEPPPPRPELVEQLSAPDEASAEPAALSAEPEPPDAAELDVALVAVMNALEAESGAKKKLLN
jgi:two-component system chemotaxis sensor kinase CheA